MKPIFYFTVLAIAISVIFMSGCTMPWQSTNNTTNQTQEYSIYGDPSQFFATLSVSNNFSVVMDLTNAASENAQAVIICGTGMAQSWGALGKNVTYMRSYVIKDNLCTTGVPGINETREITPAECESEYLQGPYTYISYGPSASYFSNSSWKIVVDNEYIKNSECGFKPSDTV